MGVGSGSSFSGAVRALDGVAFGLGLSAFGLLSVTVNDKWVFLLLSANSDGQELIKTQKAKVSPS